MELLVVLIVIKPLEAFDPAYSFSRRHLFTR
jgi:hypothetical protein